MDIVAHRGWGKDQYALPLCHENSHKAFTCAYENPNIYAAETDVREVKDGKLVLHHDPVIGTVRIKDLTFEELRNFKPYVLSLDEFVEHFPNKKVFYELKPEENNEKIVKAIFDRYIRTEQDLLNFMFISFVLENLLIVKKMNPNVYCSWIVTSLNYDPKRFQLFLHKKDVDLCVKMGIDEISGHPLSFRKSIIEYMKERKIQIGTGPVNDKVGLYKAMKLNADKIYTDKPELLSKLLSN